jgi:hypothetical protein
MSDAAKYCKSSISALSHACSGRCLSGSGKDKNGNRLYWMFYTEYLEEIKKDKDYVKKRFEYISEQKELHKQLLIETRDKGDKVICLNDLKIYDSVASASRETGLNVGAALWQNSKGEKSAGVDENGITKQWMKYDDYLKKIKNNEKIEFNPNLRPSDSYLCVPVRCIETGKEYKSIRNAYISTGISMRGITVSCETGKTIKHRKNPNYDCSTWEFVKKKPVSC